MTKTFAQFKKGFMINLCIKHNIRVLCEIRKWGVLLFFFGFIIVRFCILLCISICFIFCILYFELVFKL